MQSFIDRITTATKTVELVRLEQELGLSELSREDKRPLIKLIDAQHTIINSNKLLNSLVEASEEPGLD